MTYTSPSLLSQPKTWLVRLLNDGGRSRRVDFDRERAYGVLHNGSRITIEKETP
jgi:hypothetical protein